ncbi:MAG: helix-turn-helix transcriptional regulator [Novosphingobium sp.]
MEAVDSRRKLQELASRHGASLSQLSALIGRNPAYLHQFVNRGSPRKLDEDDRLTLARFFGVDEAELRESEENSHKQSADEQKDDWVDLPRLSLGASAGPGALTAEELPIGALRFSARWLRSQGLHAAQLSAIAVAGDSMEPTLRDGDEILVDRTPRPLRDGVHVVRVGDALLVKRIDASRPDSLALISDNPAYPPVDIPADQCEVVGKVVWKSGRL